MICGKRKCVRECGRRGGERHKRNSSKRTMSLNQYTTQSEENQGKDVWMFKRSSRWEEGGKKRDSIVEGEELGPGRREKIERRLKTRARPGFSPLRPAWGSLSLPGGFPILCFPPMSANTILQPMTRAGLRICSVLAGLRLPGVARLRGGCPRLFGLVLFRRCSGSVLMGPPVVLPLHASLRLHSSGYLTLSRSPAAWYGRCPCLIDLCFE